MAATTTIKVEFPRRQAMLSIREPASQFVRECGYAYKEIACAPVLVWPMPTNEGLFVVEHQDGKVQVVQPELLTFLDSRELFDQYDWNENV